MLNECNGCEYQCKLSHIDICTLGSPCPNQRSTPMTNGEYIRTCSTEELAECIIGVDYGADDKDTKIAKLVEWLNQPHTFIDY